MCSVKKFTFTFVADVASDIRASYSEGDDGDSDDDSSANKNICYFVI